jgi:UDP-2,3-diacylglucosamine pyrophosphatase LpxH
MEFVSDPKTILLTSDIHWDSAHCRLDILKKKFQEAVDNNSPIVICGDFFDAMQGKWDPRSSTSALRPEHRTGKYLDSLVETSAEWLKPFAKNIAMISYGNHETSIRKRHEVDLIQRLCQELKRQESPVICGQYTGFIHVVGKVKDLPSQQDSFSIHYHHGAGGGGEITRGFIDHSRTRGMYRADVFISGHIHRRNYDENIITTITSKGKLRNRKQLFLRSSCWKDEMKDEWHKIQGRGARPIGGWWLNLEMIRKKKNYELLYTAFPT